MMRSEVEEELEAAMAAYQQGLGVPHRDCMRAALAAVRQLRDAHALARKPLPDGFNFEAINNTIRCETGCPYADAAKATAAILNLATTGYSRPNNITKPVAQKPFIYPGCGCPCCAMGEGIANELRGVDPNNITVIASGAK